MRADRLLSILLLLQARGRMTARQLATEMEVSERTIYRDVVALNVAGVPVYCDRGPGGGISLLESYRTNLTGLKEEEIQALFTLSIPQPLEQLGLAAPLKIALRKLSAALPASNQGVEGQARQRIYLDSTPWSYRNEQVPFLSLLQQATWQDRCIEIVYRGSFDTRLSAIAAPYSLVSKSGEWYLVAAVQDHMRVIRVTDILELQVLTGTFHRPVDFDLFSFWQKWLVENEARHPSYPVLARCAPDIITLLLSYFGDALRTSLENTQPAEASGWVTLKLPFTTFWQARRHILGWGASVEVLDPLPLRLSVLDYARQVISKYEEYPRG